MLMPVLKRWCSESYPKLRSICLFPFDCRPLGSVVFRKFFVCYLSFCTWSRRRGVDTESDAICRRSNAIIWLPTSRAI